jgi:hypothetical protein
MILVKYYEYSLKYCLNIGNLNDLRAEFSNQLDNLNIKELS